MSEKKISVFDDKKLILIFIAIIILFAFTIRYKPYGYTIQHDYPAMIGSADANSRVSEVEWYVESKQSYYQPEWFDDSLKNVIEVEPPLSGTLAAMLSQFSRIPAADMLFFVAIFAGIGIAIVTLILFWKIFKNIWIGIIAATILIYPFESFGNFYIGIGYYPHFTQLVFIMLALIFFFKFIEEKSWSSIFGIGLMFAGAFYAHVPNALFLMFFFMLILIYFWIRKKISFGKIATIGIISVVLICPYLPIFYENYVMGNLIQVQDQLKDDGLFESRLIGTNRATSHTVQIGNFVNIVFYVFLIAGLLSFFYLKNSNYRILSLFFLFFFIIFMITNFFGVYHPHLHEKPRYIIYVFTYPIVAIGIFFISMLLKDLIKIDYKIFVGIAILILFAFQISHLIKTPNVVGSIINPDSYKGYVWAKENIPEQKRILCIGCYQFEGLYTHHSTYLPAYEVDRTAIQQVLDIAQNTSKDNAILTTSMGHSDFRLHWNELRIERYGIKPQINRSICEFDNIILKEYGQLTPAISTIANRLALKNKVIYVGNNFIIIENTNLNGDCI
ncbi:MAG: hypothetical protein ACP5NV_03340 [Candidatus Woesearchaeota archaeon]